MYLFICYVLKYIFCGTGLYRDFVKAIAFMFTSKLCAPYTGYDFISCVTSKVVLDTERGDIHVIIYFLFYLYRNYGTLF
jgi:hypothetical protein